MTDPLAAALHEPYDNPPESHPDFGVNGRCRCCGEDGEWTKTMQVEEVRQALAAQGVYLVTAESLAAALEAIWYDTELHAAVPKFLAALKDA